MKFSDNTDHNRNINVSFDDGQKDLPNVMVIQVKYLDPSSTGNGAKAIRLDNEIMHLLKASPALLDTLRQIAKCEAPYSMDRLEHAHNAVAYMRGLAGEAIKSVKTTY
jgi:hypothetical protein